MSMVIIESETPEAVSMEFSLNLQISREGEPAKFISDRIKKWPTKQARFN